MTRTTHLGMELVDFDAQPWHESYYETLRILDAVIYNLTGITNLKGAWQNSTAIVLGERYLDDATGEVYQCAVNHTSAASPTTFLADRTANPTYWTLIDAGSIAAVALLQANNFSDVGSASIARTNLGVAIGSDVQAYDAVLAATTASYTTAEETKLAGIEAAADVTDTTNVTAAGALMDSECTDLAAVKALDQGVATTDSATFAEVALTDTDGLLLPTNGQLNWGTVGQQYMRFVVGTGLEIYEGGTAIAVIGSAAGVTSSESIRLNTTTTSANVVINATTGGLKRSTSLGKYKTEVQPLNGDAILSLKPVTFKSLIPTDDTNKRIAGFIVEEVVNVFPEAAADDDENYNDRAIIAALVAKVQDLEARLSTLEGS